MAIVGSLAVVLTASATDFERTMGRAARAVKSTQKEFERSARQLEQIGQRWTRIISSVVVGSMAAVSKAAMSWEDAFAGVRKTVDATEEEFASLDESLRKMTERIPMTHREIAQIAETAGQLGIQTEFIANFTETMAMLGTATNMASEEAATALAQFANVMQTSQRNFDRIGATVVELGNNLATTERDIVEFGQRIAGAGRIAGLTEAQVLAIGGAFASVGINAEAGGTAVSKVLQSMTEAVATGKNLRGFAAVAGMSATEFATAWREDAGEAFARFVGGLGRSGEQAFTILRELGLSDQRLIRGFLSVANAGDLLRRSIDMATNAWEENTALVEEASKRYSTRINQLRMLANRFYNAAIQLGNALTPLIDALITRFESFAESAQRIANQFAKLPAPVQKSLGSFLLLLAGIGPLILAMAKVNKLIATMMGVTAGLQSFVGNVVFAFTSWRLGAAKLSEALMYLVGGPAKLTVLAIGAIAAAALYLVANWDKVSAFTTKVWFGISAVVMYSASLVVRGIGLIMTAMSWLLPSLASGAQQLMSLADGLKSSATQALQSARATAQTAQQITQTAQAAESAAKGQQNLAGAMELANDAAEAGVQSFDEVHQAQEDTPLADMLTNLNIPEVTVPEIETPASAIVESAEAMGEVITNVTDTAVSAWDRLGQTLRPVAEAAGWLRENWESIGPVVENIASLLSAALIPVLVKTGVEATIAFGKLVGNGIAAGTKLGASIVGWVSSTGPIGIAVAAIATAAILIVAYWDDIKAAIQRVLVWSQANIGPIWENIKATVVAIWSDLEAAAQTIWGNILAIIQVVHDWIDRYVVPIWNAVKDGVSAAWTALKDVALTVWGSILDAIQVTHDWVDTHIAPTWGNVKATIIAAWNSLKVAASVVWNAVLSAVRLVHDWASEHIGPIWDAIVQTVSELWNALMSTAPTVWGSINTAVQTAVNWASEHVSAVWETIKGAVTAAWDGLKNAAETVWSGILSAIQVTHNWVNENVGLIWEGIRASICAAWDALKATASTTWDAVLSAVQNVHSWVSENVAQVWEATQAVVTQAWETLKSSAETCWSAIKDAVVSATDWAKQNVASIWDGIKTAVTATWGALETVALDAWGTILSAVQSVHDWVNRNVTQQWEKVKNSVSASWDSLQRKAVEVWQSIKTTVETAWDSIVTKVQDAVNTIKIAIQELHDKVTGWFDTLKQNTIGRAEDIYNGVTGWFHDMYMRIVGGSIVPDMVAETLSWLENMKNSSVGSEGSVTQMTAEIVSMFDESYNKLRPIGSGMQDVFVNAFDGIISRSISLKDAFTSMVDHIIAEAKRMLAQKVVQTAFNLITGGIGGGGGGFLGSIGNAIGGVVKGIGKIFGFAQGGIVTAPTIAMIGEGYRREAVIPLERDNVIAESVGQAVYEAMTMAVRVAGASSSGMQRNEDREIVLRLDSATIARILLPALIREGQRQGLELVVRGA